MAQLGGASVYLAGQDIGLGHAGVGHGRGQEPRSVGGRRRRPDVRPGDRGRAGPSRGNPGGERALRLRASRARRSPTSSPCGSAGSISAGCGWPGSATATTSATRSSSWPRSSGRRWSRRCRRGTSPTRGCWRPPGRWGGRITVTARRARGGPGRRRDLHRRLDQHGAGSRAGAQARGVLALPGERPRHGLRQAGRGRDALPARASRRGDHRRGPGRAAEAWCSTSPRTGCTCRRPSCSGCWARDSAGGSGVNETEEDRPRVLGRARHLGDPGLAQGDLRRRDRRLHGRPRAGRGADPGPREGPPDRRELGPHRRPPGGVRPRLRVPRAPGQRHLRGGVPPRHLVRPPADRQGAGRGRPGRGRRRGRPRRDRQGQRPGPLRAHLRGPGPRPPGHRPLARLGPPLAHGPHGLRRAPRDPGPDDARAAVLDGPEPLPHLVRGRDPGGPVGRSRRRRCSS